ncbi:MAG TPA: RDD family protein [Nocardioidaceae bacterium]|nr:RDD family protein [Nocardioidaceae bacterium]
MTQAPPGWYPDPSPQPLGGPPGQPPGQPPRQRFWDGQAWTEHVHPSPHPATSPYQASAPTQETTTPDGVALSGWWLRVGAYAIDSVLIGGIGLLAAIPQYVRMQAGLLDLMRRFDSEVSRAGNTGTAPDVDTYLRSYMDLVLPMVTWTALATFVAWMVYGSLMLRFKGATLGKMALGISVRLRERPGRMPWSAIVVRLLVQQGVLLTAALPLLYLVLSWFPYLDNLYPLWDRRRQAIHDKAAKTNVVLDRQIAAR